MPIDLERVVGARLGPTSAAWGPDDVILYHLGIGAGVPPEDPRELAWTYERDLRVLPSFSVLPAMATVRALLRLDGLDVDVTQLLHGEHETEVHRPVPTRAEAVTEGRVSAVWDKGSAALVELEAVTAVDGEPVATNRFGFVFRGEGGFGGDPGPSRPARPAPAEPPVRLDVPTLPQQALLYRLSGDRNPLHADPLTARKAGFDRPILHGLCTYGMALKALVDTELDGDVARVTRFAARFAGVLHPGEALALRAWVADGAVTALADCPDRDAPVLANVVLDHT